MLRRIAVASVGAGLAMGIVYLFTGRVHAGFAGLGSAVLLVVAQKRGVVETPEEASRFTRLFG